MSAKTLHQKKYFHGNVASARLRPKKLAAFFHVEVELFI
jgi:hypothetical protein